MHGCVQSGTGFPDGRGFGKCVPESALRVVPTFRFRALAESATRNLLLKWDALSQQALKRRLRPIPKADSGTRFPDTKKATRRGLQLIYVADTPPHDKPCSNNKASVRAEAYKVPCSDSPAQDEGHVMWPSLFAESVSRNSCLEWDAVSAWDPIGKVCPTIQLDSGMYFPVEARWENASHFGG